MTEQTAAREVQEIEQAEDDHLDQETSDATEDQVPAAEQEIDQDDDERQADGPGREAARYRRRLREAETERDGLAAQVQALQRTVVTRVIEDTGMKAAAVFATVDDVAMLLGEDGQPDQAKILSAIEQAREQFGITGRPSFRIGGMSSGATGSKPTAATWADAFRASQEAGG